MNQRFTLTLALSVGLIASAWSQTSTAVTGVDSLAGFNRDSVVFGISPYAEKHEVDNIVRLAERNFIDKKYSLGRYDPNFTPPAAKQNTPVFPVAFCTNVDFETGDFSGWAGAVGDNDVNSFGPLSNIVPGLQSTTLNAALGDNLARHTIMTNAFGPDPMGGFPVVPPGGGMYSVRLGGQTPNYQGEILEQTFTVSNTSTSFVYQYAVVLNSGGHPDYQQPYFRIEVLDQNGLPISPCTQLYVAAGTTTVNPGFFVSPSDPSTYYKPWTLVNFDLTPFIGQNLTVRFTVAGCTQSGHYGYAYVDCSCSALAATVNFCPGNTQVFLTAPDGYAYYQWFDPNHNPIPNSNNDTLIIVGPNVGDTFYVDMTSSVDTTCHTPLSVALQYTDIFANAVSTDESCYQSNDGTLTAAGSAGILPYTYSWNTTPPSSGPSINNVPPGTYIVHLTDSLGCESWDTTVVLAAPRLDTSIFTYTFCPGDPHITLTAPPGYQSYQWIDPQGNPMPPQSPPNTIYLVGPQTGDLYTCILTPLVGCPIWDTVVLNLNPPVFVFSPDSMVNVFTPNADQKNDYFYPFFDHTVSQQTANPSGAQPAYDFFELYVGTYEIWVYNRWGQQVFYSNDYNIGWDGKIDGKEASAGTYYYITKFTTRCRESTEPITNTGFVHLLR